MKNTKVVCTIGPASEEITKLEKLINAGMNVMRMNFSHGDHEEQGARIVSVKALNEKNNWNVGIMLDTKGPEIRTGYMKEGYADIEQGSTVRVTFDYSYECTAEKIALSYAGLYDDIKVGERILIEDGNLGLLVVGKDEENRELITEALNSRRLKNKKNVNVPGVVLNMNYISEKDYGDFVFGVEQDVDFIAASFVRRPQDILDIRKVLADHNNSNIKIISKIENQEGVDNMEEIIALSDGVMVARGDLGVDVPAWEVPAHQKRMIELAQSQGKIVVTATQMLDSMITNPRPTRAEVSDVFNAVLDGTSATMLSGESANGDYPVETVTYMATIDERAEEDCDYAYFAERALSATLTDDPESAVCYAAVRVAAEFGVSAIIAEGTQEFLYKLSGFRPCVNVFAGVATRQDARAMAIAYGIYATVGGLEEALAFGKEKIQLQEGETVLFVTKDSFKVVTL